MAKTTKNARGSLRIKTGGFMSVEGGIIVARVKTNVDILYETPESFRVEYSTKFKEEHPGLCESNIVRKDDDKRELSYTRFIATFALPADCGVKHALFTIKVLIPLKSSIRNGTKKADVLIVEETETHYRLRFAAAFAKEHPNLCNEWVRKDSTDPKIEIVN